MKTLYSFALLAFAVTTYFVRGASGAVSPPSPILVELFTSEGCSSCPPADEWAQRVEAAQPIPGGQLILLSEHVDYWNHDGWKDPYSSALLTDRQSSYSRALRLPEVYTPQLIVNGTTVLRLANTSQTAAALSKAAATVTVPIRIALTDVQGGSAPTVCAHVETDALRNGTTADVYLAVALNRAETQVLRGENSGRHLTHVAVVQSLQKIGKVHAGNSFAYDYKGKLKSGTKAGDVRLVAFLQEPGPGKILGAAMLRLADSKNADARLGE